MTKEIPWGRVLVEGAVIVASILLAFGVDAWWAERGEKRAEREELSDIRQELAADRGRLEVNVRRQAQRAEAAEAVVGMISDLPNGSGTLILSDTLVALLVQAPTFEARTPALSGLRESGRVSLIRDANVRRALANWERLLTNVSEREVGARDVVEQMLVPALIERGDVGPALRTARLNARGASWEEAGLEGQTTLRADLELSGWASQRYATVEHASNTLTQALTALEELVSAIEGALGS